MNKLKQNLQEIDKVAQTEAIYCACWAEDFDRHDENREMENYLMTMDYKLFFISCMLYGLVYSQESLPDAIYNNELSGDGLVFRILPGNLVNFSKDLFSQQDIIGKMCEL